MFYGYCNASVLLLGQIKGPFGCKFWLQIRSVLEALNESESQSNAIVQLK